jgi:hypothetical protein
MLYPLPLLALTRGFRGCNNSFGYLRMSGLSDFAREIGGHDPERTSMLPSGPFTLEQHAIEICGAML